MSPRGSVAACIRRMSENASDLGYHWFFTHSWCCQARFLRRASLAHGIHRSLDRLNFHSIFDLTLSIPVLYYDRLSV